MRYDEALTEADESGFAFTTATTEQLQHALEVLTQHDDEHEHENEEEVVEEEEVYDWEELEEEEFVME